MRILAIALCVLASASLAAAQTVELGGRVASACVGSDGSICGGGTSPLVGGHASVWFDDRFELGTVVSRLTRPSFEYPEFETGAHISVTDRKRDFASLLFVYHFLKGQPVRTMLGFGSGWYADARRVTCRSIPCEKLPPGGPLLGQYRKWDLDAVFVVGLSGVMRDRWVVRGGWQSHRFGNDENSTQQLFMGVGYRFN